MEVAHPSHRLPRRERPQDPWGGRTRHRCLHSRPHSCHPHDPPCVSCSLPHPRHPAQRALTQLGPQEVSGLEGSPCHAGRRGKWGRQQPAAISQCAHILIKGNQKSSARGKGRPCVTMSILACAVRGLFPSVASASRGAKRMRGGPARPLSAYGQPRRAWFSRRPGRPRSPSCRGRAKGGAVTRGKDQRGPGRTLSACCTDPPPLTTGTSR